MDGKITDQEWAEVGQNIGACLQGKGVTFRGFRPDGSYSVSNGKLSGDEVNALLPKCEKSSGEQAIGYLRNVMTINPNNEPIGQIMAECLVRLHVVAPGYTKDDYLRDAPTQSFPYLDPSMGKADFDQCNSNPSIGLGK